MNVREYIASAPDLVRIDAPVSSHLEAAAIIAALGDRPALLTNVDGGKRVLSGFAGGRERIAQSLGISGMDLLHRLADALENPQPTSIVSSPPCQEVVYDAPDLTRLPILKHLADDGGRYVTAGVATVRDPEFGRNVSYHRLMVIGEREMVARVVEGRGTHTAWSRGEEDVPIAIAIGCPVSVLLAAAMSPAKGVDEYGIAQAIAPTPLARCLTAPLEVPAEAEIVIEGRLTHRLALEGPFIDLTETWDAVRPQPVLEVDCITTRRDPVYHAILPGMGEHKTIMGVPREPGMLAAVARVCEVLDVGLTPGGMSWLHALIRICKRGRDDGPAAIRAAMAGHPSVKHVVVVDEDVDIRDPLRVEWSIATRVQAAKDVYIYADQPSSSLDPSSRQVPGRRGLTDKLGIDATIPWPDSDDPDEIARHTAGFRCVAYEQIDLSRYAGRD